MRLLAVDDDHFARDLLFGALASSGYDDLVMAASGHEALDILVKTSRPFDAFLLDIRMPGMDGIELCARIRGMDQYRNAPILMITAMSERHYIDGAFAAGALDYISKPFEALELGARLRTVERIVRQNHLVAQGNCEIDRLRSAREPGMAFDVDGPVEIVDVPRVVGLVAMENYLLRLTRWMTWQSESVAFTIDGFDTMTRFATPVEIYDILSDTADAIVRGLKRDNHLVTYVGNGTFVAVLHRKSSVSDPDTLMTIQALLDLAEPSLDSGVPCPLNLRVGPVYRPSLIAAGNPLALLTMPGKTRATTRSPRADAVQPKLVRGFA